MNYVEISDLLTKGFTPEQIVMLSGANTTEPEHSPAPEPDGGQDPAPEPEHSENEAGSPGQDPAPEPEHSPDQSPEMKALRDEMKALKEAIQAQNIITQHMENLPPSSESTESILAGIIRPPFENKKD